MERPLQRPGLDMSDVLLDTDFLDSLTCLRNVQTVGNDGMASIAQTELQFRSVVTSARGADLRRGPDGQVIAQTISIIGLFPLQVARLCDGVQYTADIVCWRGNQYTVVNIADYSSFGRGFTQAIAELLPLTT